MPNLDSKWKIGSTWMRWDPHVHAPGTLRNDQFGNDWTGYIHRLETADPAPVALGITDYFTLRSYEKVFEKRQQGALSKISLIFANVELRLNMQAKSGAGVNIHLLVSPDDPRHVVLMKERLARLSFKFNGEPYPCSDEGLARLGRAFKNDPGLNEETALSEGANQFKVSFNDLHDLYLNDEWLQKNVLIAVAAADDGLSGLSGDSGFAATRQEIAKFSQIIFSGNPAERKFWLGGHTDFEKLAYIPKPCLHGSDAHKLDQVLQPTESRYCWIRAEPTFEGLRQTLAEPERRVHIGEAPPVDTLAGDVIQKVKFSNARWMKQPELSLNPGLVTVIGARGSGKTALADLVAFAAESDDDPPGEASFIAKARNLLDGTKTELKWGNNFSQEGVWPRDPGVLKMPRVRYLSQKFVEQLCTPSGLSEPLVHELEQIVFNALPIEDRLQCSSFDELRTVRLEGIKSRQEAEEEEIRAKTRLVAEQWKVKNGLPKLEEDYKESVRKREALQKDLGLIPVKGSDAKSKELEAVEKRLTDLQELIAAEERRNQSLQDLTGEINRQLAQNERAHQSLKEKFEPLLDDGEWDLFRFKLDSRALSVLREKDRATQDKIKKLKADGNTGVADNGVDALKALKKKVLTQIGLDEANAKKRFDIQSKLKTAQAAEAGFRQRLAEAKKSDDIIDGAQKDRLESYEQLFEALLGEKAALEEMYKPLKKRLDAEPGLERLSFSVERHVDLDAWVKNGEKLFDLRKGPFRGDGALEAAARKILLPAWSSGTPAEIKAAILKFIEVYGADAIKVLTAGNTALNFGLWLFSTGHIGIRYGVQYEGVDLQRLSPGTRGVVLLTLYLGLDEWDQRPLVVDQPEENLDPQSVFSQLVPFFKNAARRRQIIMVTHNANLVVNTDSDQVIVAKSVRTAPDRLPDISYMAGGLEDLEIRSEICNILEGGVDAFKKRSQRYGIKQS